MVAGAGDRPAAAAVVDQRVARLLEHPLLVADDDLGRAELEQPLEPVVAVDDAAVQVVQVGGREAAAVELDHRPQVRRDDRQDRQDHPVGPRAGAAERLDEAEPLDRLLAALAGARPDLDVERAGQLLEVHPADDLADGLGAHAGAEERGRPWRPSRSARRGRGSSSLAERLHRLEALDLVAQLARARPCGPGPAPASCSRSSRSVSSIAGREVGDLLLDRALLVAPRAAGARR